MKFKVIATLVLVAVLGILAVLYAPGSSSSSSGSSSSSSDDAFRIKAQ